MRGAGAARPGGTPGCEGPTGCRYLADERQATYVRNGWNLTGDAYRIAEDGQFEYQARTDDMIVSGGYNIAGPRSNRHCCCIRRWLNAR